jgi:hypothetical protein
MISCGLWPARSSDFVPGDFCVEKPVKESIVI